MSLAELPVPADLTEVLQALKRGLGELYGPRLRGLWLYGSQARGEATAGSDVDVLVVLTDFSDIGEEIDRTSELRARLSLKCGRTLSLIPLRWKSFCERRTPLIQNARRDGVPL